MYSFVKAIGVEKGFNGRWKDVAIGDIKVVMLFPVYAEMYITLSNPFLEGNVTITLESLRYVYYFFNGTFNELLLDIGGNALETVPQDSVPVINPTYVTYHDAFRSGYTIEPVDIFTSPTSPSTQDDKTSVRISRTKIPTDMKVFYENCLVSVNGFLCRTDYDGTYAYAIGANSSRLKSHQNQIGFINFIKVGKVQCVAIDPSMISAQAPTFALKQRIYVKLNQDLTNKTVLLSLGGYLMFTDGSSFFQTGEDIFAIDISKIPFLERYYEAQKYINYESLGLPVSTDNPDTVLVSELTSDAVLTKYLGLPQSFFIVVDTPRMFSEKHPIKDVGFPGKFVTYSDPVYPLIVANGRMAEYWKTYEDGQWSLSVYDSYLHNKVLSSVPVNSLVQVSTNDVPMKTVYNSDGYLLEIGKDF